MYTPINLDVYTMAFEGASSGMISANRINQNASSTNYDTISAVAGAWATQFDMSWGSSSSLTEGQALAINNLSLGFWSNRVAEPTPTNLLPATWQTYTNALVAIVQSNDNYLASQGIIPNGWRPGGCISFVFRPNGTASETVFTTEESLAAATQELDGAPYTILWDFSLVGGHYTLQTVGLLDLAANGTWTDGGLYYTLIFQNGTTLPYLPSVISGALSVVSVQASPINTGSIFGFQMAMTEGATFQSNNGPLISSVDGGYYTLLLQNESYLYNSNSLPCMVADGTSTVACFVEDGAGLFTINAVHATAGGTANVFNSSSDSYVDPSMYPILVATGYFVDYAGGAHTVVPPDNSRGGVIFEEPSGTLYWSNGVTWSTFDASTFSYTASNLANWSGVNPTSIQNALDRIAAKITPIP
jgi:hypothetical protein